MRKEVIDPNSGAILFKKDEDTLDLEGRLERLEARVKELTKKINKLEKGT